MPAPADAIFGKLTTTDAVSGLIDDRVYPAQAVQTAAFPLVAYEVSSEYDLTYSGPSGLSSHTLLIACVALSHDEASNLADAVREAINSQSGTWGGQIVRGCFVTDVGDALEVDLEIEKRTWRKDIQALLWIAEA